MQQDGVTYYTLNVTLLVVKETFPKELISCRGDILWPLSSWTLHFAIFLVEIPEKSNVP